MLFVILVCEFAGRQKDRMGRGLAYVAVALSSIPVVWSMSLLLYHTFVDPLLARDAPTTTRATPNVSGAPHRNSGAPSFR